MTVLTLLLLYSVIVFIALALAGHNSRRAPAQDIPVAKPTKVLIIGATGGTGRQLVTKALERDYKVTALVRNPAKLEIEHPELNVVQGDVLDTDSVDRAMQGQEAVVSALGHKRFFYPTRILSNGTRNILEAMEKHGVRRLVCQTSLGIGNSAGRMGLLYTFFVIPVILPWYFWDKTRQERIIAGSNADWIIVRPGALTNGTERGHVRHGNSVGNFIWGCRISRADTANFMLDQLESDRYLKAAPGICW